MFSTSVDKILKDFYKVQDKLNKHMDNVSNQIVYKRENIAKLNAELNDHHNELARAMTVLDNIGRLLGK